MISPTIQQNSTPQWTLLAAAPLAMSFVIFTISYLSSRWEPVDGAVLWLLLAPLLWLGGTHTSTRFDREQWHVIVAMLGLLMWMAALQCFLPNALPCGWWRIGERCAYLSAFILIIIAKHEPDRLMRMLGSSAVVAAAGALLVNLANGAGRATDTRCYGFGHINIIANTAGPSIIAWWVWLLHSRSATRKISIGSWHLPCLGGIAMLGIAVGTQRRGAILAAVAVALSFAWYKIYSKSRTAGWIIAGAATSAVTFAMVSAFFSSSIPTLRNERIALYRAGFDGVIHSFPFGYGHYGAKQIVELQTEHARHLTATGSWGWHIHNEALDVLLDGGFVALALVGILVTLTIRRWSRLKEPQAKPAFAALGIAVFVHSMTDNVYGTEFGQAWLAAAFGILWAMPAESTRLESRIIFSPRQCQWPLVIGSYWCATHAIYPAVLHRDACPAVRYQSMVQALNPQVLNSAAINLLSASDPALNIEDRRHVLALAIHRGGSHGLLASYNPDNFPENATDRQVNAAAILGVLQFSPFNKSAYEALVPLYVAHSETHSVIPRALQVRLLYLSGRKNLPKPDLEQLPLTMDAAVDLYAGINWSIANNIPWPDISVSLHNLCLRYGDIPGVTQLVIEATAVAPPGSFPWLADVGPILVTGLRYIPAVISTTLEKIQTPLEAEAVIPLLQVIGYSEVLRAIKQGRMDSLTKETEANIAIYCHIVRIHALAISRLTKVP